MEKRNYPQLELFSDSKDSDGVSKGLTRSFLSRIWNYEKILLSVIGFVVIGVVSFSLGVEKGKRMTTVSGVNFNALKEQPSISAKETIRPQYTAEIQKQVIVELPKDKKPAQNYIIQLASYKTKAFAQKEARILKIKGYSPLISSKSGYEVLSVGNFSKREKAESLLSELKKRYRDCMVRRL